MAKKLNQTQSVAISPLSTSSSSATTTTHRTIIAFVNPGSGGGQGVKVLADLKVLLGEGHCFDLKADSGPQKGLQKFKDNPNLIVVAAGGDGTVGWLLSVIDTMNFDTKPAVCPLALGTGNDMSRVLQWGPGYTGEDLAPVVDKIKTSTEVLLDRWLVVCKPISEADRATLQDTTLDLSESEDEDDSTDKGEKDETDEEQRQLDEKALLASPLVSTNVIPSEDSLEYDSNEDDNNFNKDSTDDDSLEDTQQITATITSTTTATAKPARPTTQAPTSKPEVRNSQTLTTNTTITTTTTTATTTTSTTASTATSPTTAAKKKQEKEKKKFKHRKDYAKEERREFIANNYFSIGIDSDILLQWDKLRTNHPELFPHRAVNFGWYGMIGLKSMVKSFKSLRKFTKLYIDDVEIKIGKAIRAIVLLNVPSYSGGTNPWKKAKNVKAMPEKQPQCINDGIIEVFGMLGAFHIGRNIAGMSRGGIRIGQGKKIEIVVTEPVAAQVDGEPYLFVPCKVAISHKNKAKMMFNGAKDKDGIKLKKLNGLISKEANNGNTSNRDSIKEGSSNGSGTNSKDS